MTELQYQTINNKKVYDIPDNVCRELLKKGGAALAQCYPKPGDGYAVALLTSQGNIFTGASYKSDTATLTMHSEAVALARAAQHGETGIVAITGPNCHICKQLIWESSLRSGIDTLVVMEGENGAILKVPISAMMPYPWPEKLGEK